MDPHPTRTGAAETTSPDGPGPAADPRPAVRYALGDEIARGGMGVVYRAIDTTFGREVAVKVLLDKYGPASGTARRFRDEARITGQLQHPGIPPAHDLGTLPDGRPFLAMKLIKGETLDELLKGCRVGEPPAGSPAPPPAVGRFVAAFEKACEAVAYAHSRGVVHRDLKPSNVMVGAFGEVQVMDWGLAKVLASGERQPPGSSADPDETAATGTEVRSLRDSEDLLTQAGSVLGTPAFMPPEQAVGAVHEIDGRSDVFGLGGILAAILTGKPPFVGDTAETTRVMAARGEIADCFARLDGCGADPELVALCKRCLAPKREDRPADAGAVAKAVAELRVAADDRARRAEEDRLAAVVRAAEQHKRRRAIQRAGGTVLVILILGVAGTTVGLLRADAARRKEEAARERAETNYGRSLRAADALSEELARGILPIAGTQAKTVVAILDRVRGISDELLADPDAPPEALERRAKLLTQFAELYRLTNRSTPARQASEQAVELYDRLLAADGANRELKIGRARANHRLGWILHDQGHLDRALVSYRASIEEFEAAGGEADPVAAAVVLGGAYTLSGHIFMDYGDHDAAAAANRRGLEVRRKARAASAHPDVRMQLSYGLEQVGSFEARFRRSPHGIEILREALSEMEAICKDDPWNAAYHLHLLLVRTSLAELSRDDKEQAAALDANQAVADRFVGRDPDHMRWTIQAIRLRFYRNDLRARGVLAVTPAERDAARAAEPELLGELLAAARRLSDQDPENYISLADVANFHGRVAEALRNRAIGDPARAADLRAKARADAAESVRLYERVLARCPQQTGAGLGLNFALGVISRIEDAWGDAESRAAARSAYLGREIALYQRLVARYPGSAYWQWQLGLSLTRKKDWDAAAAALREAVRLDATNANAHLHLGGALDNQGDLKGTMTHYREAVRLDPKYAEARYFLGIALQREGNLDGAVAEYRESIRLDPNNSDTHSRLGWLVGSKGDPDGAAVHHREAIRLDPNNSDAHFNLGWLLSNKGDQDGGIRHYRAAIRLDPKNAIANYNLGWLLSNKGDQDGAIRHYQEAVRLDPKNVPGHSNLGVALQNKGNLDGAIAEYKEVLRLDPKNEYAIRYLPRAERMRILLPRLPGVIAGTDRPVTPAEAVEFGQLCKQPFQNRFAAAARLYEQAFAADPDLAVPRRDAPNHLYDAACYAARAARGDGVDAPADPVGRVALRVKALGWLRADLAVWRKRAASSSADERKVVDAQLAHWLTDTDLTETRGGIIRIGMPAAERAEWDALWSDVRAALAEARKPPPPLDTAPSPRPATR